MIAPRPLTAADRLRLLDGDGDPDCTTISPADEHQPSSWLPVDLGPALRGEQTAPEPGILTRSDGLGLLYRGKVHVLAGEPESGKSWLAQLAAAIVLMAGGHVVYIDFEDDALGIVGRFRALGVTPEQIMAGLVYLRPDEALGDNGHLLDQACAGSELAVLDGTTEAMAVHGWAPKNDVDVALFQARILRRMSSSGAAVVVIDHVVKSTVDRGRWATGSQHKLAGVDGAQYLIEVIKPWAPGRSGLASVAVTKDRPGRVRAGLEDTSMKAVGTMVVTAWPDGGVRIELQPPMPITFAADGQPRPTILMEKVSRYLAAHTEEDLSGRQILGDVKGDDKALRRALKVLVAEGYVTRVDQGQAQYHRLAKPYEQATDPDLTGRAEGEENP